MTKDCFNCKFGDVALCNEPCKTCKFNPTDPPTHWQAPDVATRDGVAAITWYGKYKVLHAENERLKAEVERLQISEVEQIARNISEMRAIQVRAENERLTKALDDYHATFERVMNEQCPTDEKHCGCVPILRAEIERLCKVLRMSRPYLLYADTAHEPPKELIAEIDEALKGGDE